MPTHQLESQFLQTNTIKLLKFLATQKLHLKFHGNFKFVCLTFLVLCTVCLFFGIILLRSLKPREHQLFPLNNPK
uniref:Glutamine synthetase n=1 Tax=Solanum tuberosum TaxID=4113 RepID=M1BHZ3_SOLTU